MQSPVVRHHPQGMTLEMDCTLQNLASLWAIMVTLRTLANNRKVPQPPLTLQSITLFICARSSKEALPSSSYQQCLLLGASQWDYVARVQQQAAEREAASAARQKQQVKQRVRRDLLQQMAEREDRRRAESMETANELSKLQQQQRTWQEQAQKQLVGYRSTITARR